MLLDLTYLLALQKDLTPERQGDFFFSSRDFRLSKMGRNSRLQQWIKYRVRVALHDTRMLVGTLVAFDRHMNIVLADCEEFRLCKKKAGEPRQEVKRVLGLVMLRGENVVSLTAEL